MGFHYIAGKECSNHRLKLDILMAGQGFYLGDILFDVVSDIKIDSRIKINPMKMKRLCIQFRDLTPNQIFQLEYFIQNYSTCEAQGFVNQNIPFNDYISNVI